MSKTHQPNRLTHSLYVVQGEGDNALWTEIGALWAHQDGKGFNVSLQALPIISAEHRVVIRARKAKEEAGR